MPCSFSGHTNPSRGRFCLECGRSLALRCPRCQADLPATAKFCPECGTPAAHTDGTPEPRPPTPPAPGPDLGLAGERRQLTVLFCDLVGSMELAARLDPEDWPDVLRTYRTRAGEVVARHGGHVAQYFGDGILIYFGWPKTYDDTAERAGRVALGSWRRRRPGVRTVPCFPCASGST